MEAFPTLGMKHHSHLPPPRGWCGEGAMPSRLARSTAVVKGTHRLLCKDLTARINVFILRIDETSRLHSFLSTLTRFVPRRCALGWGQAGQTHLAAAPGSGDVLARQPRCA